jgi:hypothetical protein
MEPEKKVQTEAERAIEFLNKQQAILKWIETVTNTPIFQKPDDFVPFEEVLSDGVLLCQLIAIIAPRTITKWHKKPDEYKAKQNLFIFIEACRKYGIGRQNLFTETSLLEGRDIPKVVECLEALDRRSMEKGFNLHIAVVQDHELDPKLIENAKAQLRKQKLRKNATEMQLNTEKANALLRQPEEKAKTERLNKSAVRIQSLFRGKLVRQKYRQRVLQHDYRTRVVQEILETEEGYVNGLRVLIEVYKKPMQELVPKVLTNDQMRTIFSEIEVIYGFNERFLSQLRPRIQNWSPSQTLGDLFNEIVVVSNS